jgi:hypothetical protein
MSTEIKTIKNVSIVNKDGIHYSIAFNALVAQNQYPDENTVPISIYYDDTVQTAKYKIMEGLKVRNIEDGAVNYEELYLFSIIERDFDVFQWYKLITVNNTVSLTTPILQQWCMTVHFETNEYDNEMQPYISRKDKNSPWSYTDILEIPWFSKKQKVFQKVPLGVGFQLSTLGNKTYIPFLDETFCANPYDNIIYKDNVEKQKWKNKSVLLKNDEMMIHYGPFYEDTVFVVLARDIIHQYPNPNDMEVFMEFYFPYLFKQNIRSPETLLEFTKTNEAKTRENLESKKKTFHSMDMFYGVRKEPLPPFQYKERGIEYFHIGYETILTFIKYNIPLETIFQHIHAKKEVPYIQFYKDKHEEPMIRLYSTETSANSKKIPYLSENTIKEFHDNKRTSRLSHIVMYLEINSSNKQSTVDDYIQIVIEQNGNIQFQGKCVKPMVQSEFEPWFIAIINQNIETINQFIRLSGYTIHSIRSLQDSCIKIYSLQYLFSFDRSKMVDLSNRACLSPVLYSKPIMKETKLEQSYRYKRVENFTAVNAEEEFISTVIKTNSDSKYVLQTLRIHYPEKSDFEIKTMLNNFTNKYSNAYGKISHRRINSIINAGFPVSINQFNISSEFIMRISNIDKLWYLQFIDVYMESIFHLSQNAQVSGKWVNEWNRIQNNKQTTIEDAVENNTERDQRMEPVVVVDAETPESEGDGDSDSDDDDDKSDYDVLEFYSSSDEEEDEKETGDDNSDDNPQNNDNNKKKGVVENKVDEEDDFTFGGGRKPRNANTSTTAAATEKITQYFENRMKNRITMFEEKMNNYTKQCQFSQGRQPVILTKEEKERIDDRYKDVPVKPYGNVLEYEKDKNNTNQSLYFVCPRYWCIQPGNERPLTEEEVKKGVCGKVIQNEKEPKEGEYIYDRGEQYNPNPGFLKPKNNSKSCVPCCFKEWDGETQIKNRNTCNPDVYKNTDIKNNRNKKIIIDNEKNDYIYNTNYENKNIEQGRFAKIPMSIKTILGIESDNKCIEQNTVKDDCHVFLRNGVEKTENDQQSFLACMAVAYSEEKGFKPAISVKEFKTVLTNAITLDLFVSAQNATLVSQFQPKTKRKVSVDAYKQTKLYSKLNVNQESQRTFLEHTILAYEEFLRYIMDDSVLINPTFLWDILSLPNKNIFANGLNILIVESLENDVSNKINIICPTNHYSDVFFESDRNNILLFLQENSYQVITSYRRKYTRKGNVGYEYFLKRLFSLEDTEIQQIHPFIRAVHNIINRSCIPKHNNLLVYNSVHNLPIDTLLKKINANREAVITKFVMNYQGKYIALMIHFKNQDMYLPCLPSTSSSTESIHFPTIWIDDVKWSSYEDTYVFLKTMHETFNIPSTPVRCVEENGVIIGILTETNQLVLLKDPVEKSENRYNMKLVSHMNSIYADKWITNYQYDSSSISEHDKTIQYIHLENEFYRSFRTTVRMLMTLLKNRLAVEKMLAICTNKSWTYQKKMTKVIEYLKKISTHHIDFAVYDEAVLLSLNDIFTCDANHTNSSHKKYCVVSTVDNRINKLLIPQYHLLTKQRNETIYYTRLADELIRNNRVHLLMFYPQQFTNVSSNEYKVLDDEILIPKVLLQTYFKNIKKHAYGRYATNVPYENAVPIDA